MVICKLSSVAVNQFKDVFGARIKLGNLYALVWTNLNPYKPLAKVMFVSIFCRDKETELFLGQKCIFSVSHSKAEIGIPD